MFSLTIRPIQPGDRLRIIASRHRFSDQTVYQRFHIPMPKMSKGMLKKMTEPVAGQEQAFVALDGDTLIGVARWVRYANNQDRAEVAFIIADDWQGRGLGSFLLKQLVHDAAENDVKELSAYVQRTNNGIYRLFGRALGEPDERKYEGSAEELVYYLPYQHTAEYPIEHPGHSVAD